MIPWTSFWNFVLSMLYATFFLRFQIRTLTSFLLSQLVLKRHSKTPQNSWNQKSITHLILPRLRTSYFQRPWSLRSRNQFFYDLTGIYKEVPSNEKKQQHKKTQQPSPRPRQTWESSTHLSPLHGFMACWGPLRRTSPSPHLQERGMLAWETRRFFLLSCTPQRMNNKKKNRFTSHTPSRPREKAKWNGPRRDSHQSVRTQVFNESPPRRGTAKKRRVDDDRFRGLGTCVWVRFPRIRYGGGPSASAAVRRLSRPRLRLQI